MALKRHADRGRNAWNAVGRPGFTLVEILLALAVCAVGLTTGLALLAASARDAGRLPEHEVAMRVVYAVEAEVRRAGFSAVGAALVHPESPLDEMNGFFASRDGFTVGPSGSFPENERFYGIVLERDRVLSPAVADAVAGFLAFQVRIEWPVVRFDGTTVAPADRTVRRVSMVVRR